MFNVQIQSGARMSRAQVPFLCPGQEKKGGLSKVGGGGGGGRLHWRVQGSRSSPTGIGSRRRVYAVY